MYRLSCLIYNGTLIRVVWSRLNGILMFFSLLVEYFLLKTNFLISYEDPMEENVRNSKLEKRQFLPHYLSDKVLLDTIVNQACFSGNGG